ncbi:MAG: hypothetical protein CL670_04870 [Balneola sp.]|jgi:hypothetical protein|nr:hypothetical protein [Balneola sp.]MBE78464.1 hypothetical protein [Balneola sp.]HBX66618.1 hypothetical protein [Balneolaceae bacterium]|tara:strand:+ start:221 stop:496 length:276 start_codon:yes stop_codon:yes gene_type:complete
MKNLHSLDLPEKEQSKLDKACGLYAANSNIHFKVLKQSEHELIIRVHQNETVSGKYLDAKELISRTKGLFSEFFPNHDTHVRPLPFRPPNK